MATSLGKRKYQPGCDDPTKKSRSCTPSVTSSEDSDYESDFNISSPVSTPRTPLTPSQSSNCKKQRPNKYHCPFGDCQKVFNRPTRLSEHVRSHTNDRPFKCSHQSCTKSFLRQTHLSRHVKDAHTTERSYVCTWPHCDKTFTTGTRLRRHEDAHRGKQKFQCTDHPPCDQIFRKQATLQRHIVAEHLQLKPFRCSQIDEELNQICESGFDSLTKLRAHEARSHGERLYLCTFCSKDTSLGGNLVQSGTGEHPHFASYAELKAHVKGEHPPKCEYCSMVCSTSRDLQKHVDIHHSGTTLEMRQTVLCTVPGCGKGFTKQSNLNSHIRTVHQGTRAFQCGFTDLSQSHGIEDWDGRNACHKAFSAKATLEGHVRRHHVGKGAQSQVKGVTRPNKNEVNMKAKTSLASRLTGVGYLEESGREIACLASECSYLFKRNHDLMSHARTAHEMTEEDVAEALAEREALSGGKFWLGGEDEDEDEVFLPLEDDDEDNDWAEWREASGLDVLGIDVHGDHGMFPYRVSEPPAAGQSRSGQDVNARPLHQLDLGALVDFCSSNKNEASDNDRQNCIDPALTNT